MGRFQFEEVAIPALLITATAVVLIYLCYPPFFIFIASALTIAAYVTKNQKCLPADVENFFSGFHVGGHRGSPHSFPENSMAGFKQAKIDGADLIEFDVALTSDKKAVLMHDDDLDRTTNLTGPIRDKSRKQLDSANISANFVRKINLHLDPVEAEKVPDMEELIKWSVDNQIRMLFDVKDADTELVDQIATLFEKYNLYDKAIVCSFFPWVVYTIKKGNQRILTGLTWRQKFWSYHDIENTKPRYSGIKQAIFELIDEVHVFLLKRFTPWYLGADLLLTNNLDISQGLILDQRRRGMRVAVWTVNDMAEMHWMLETLKIPILTDYPEYTKKSDFVSDSRVTTTSGVSTYKMNAPNLEVEYGDKKFTYHLADGGKLIKMEKANGEMSYALRCVDGRRVFLDRTSTHANLALTDAKGKVKKTLAAEY